MSDQTVRKDAGKLDLSLPPPEWNIIQADILGAGAVKYSRDGWRAGTDDQRLIAALERHLSKARMGEVFDIETGCIHWGQVAWNANVLAMQQMYRRLGLKLNGQATYEQVLAELYDPEARDAFIKENTKLE